MLPLDCGLDFDPAREEEFFAAIPSHPGVFVLEPRAPRGQTEAQPYLARTADLRRALERLLCAAEQPLVRLRSPQARRLSLREVAASVRYRLTGSKFEQALVLYQQARERFPQRYRDLLRLRPPALLKVNLQNEYPRCYVTRRIFSDGGFYFGPFPSRKVAESFADGFLDLFKMRRCQIKIRRDPAFPGCIYSEMKMCLAPCFGGCSKQEYDVEVGRVLEALASEGAALAGELERERETASEALDFERAAALHQRLEKASGVLRRLPGLARRVDEFDAVILQRAAEENSVVVFVVCGGLIANALLLRFAEPAWAGQPRSVEEVLRRHLEPPVNTDEPGWGSHQASPSAKERLRVASGVGACGLRFGLRAAPEALGENLSLLARWFYSKPREGEIFFPSPDWPYRRIIRACSRILAPPPA